MLRYETHSLPPRAKLAYWNDVFADFLTPLETRSASPDHFDAEVTLMSLGKCRIGNIISPPSHVERSARHVARSRQPRYFLHLPTQGRIAVRQDGRECVAEPGDMVIVDSTAPYSLDHCEPCDMLVLAIEAGELKKRIPAPAEMLGVKLTGRHGLTATASVTMHSVWEQAKAGLIPDEAAECVCSNLLDLFATSCVAAGIGVGLIADSAVTVGRRMHIRRYIEANLRDPDLSARSIAAAFGISARYLHIIFSGEDETVSSYVLRRRLEETAKQLVDPAWRRRTITELAFGWGFNNATHFARVFKEKMGCSPREYRVRTAQASAA